MLSIHPEVKDFGNEDETNYETDEINNENMKEFCIFVTDQKIGKYKTYNKIRQVSLVQVLSREERVKRSKILTFLHCNTLVKSIGCLPFILVYKQ